MEQGIYLRLRAFTAQLNPRGGNLKIYFNFSLRQVEYRLRNVTQGGSVSILYFPGSPRQKEKGYLQSDQMGRGTLKSADNKHPCLTEEMLPIR